MVDARTATTATGHPGGSVDNLETFSRRDVSSNLGAVARPESFDDYFVGVHKI